MREDKKEKNKKQDLRKKEIKIELKPEEHAFDSFLRPFRTTREEKEVELSKVSLLRKLLTNEKARILHILKVKNPSSIYQLAKLLERDFKSVRDDVILMKKVGLISLKKESKGKRKMLKPVLNVDKLEITIEF